MNIRIVVSLAVTACAVASSAIGAPSRPALKHKLKGLTQTPTPMPVSIEADMDEAVVLDGKSAVTVECPDPAAAKWIEAHFAEWFPGYAPKVIAGSGGVAAPLPDGDEAYAVKIDASGVKVAARTLAGARWAAYTIRQLAIAKRGTFKTEGLMLPKSDMSDCPLKHSVLDFHPEHAPLFEPNGWRWCLSNPEAQRVLRELIAEMHESFGNPPYFHIGCDEAHTPSCPSCGKADYAELVLKHIGGIAGFLRERGARAMMWHDMLVTKGDPEWKGVDPVYGSKATASILGKLPKDIIICDYEYSYSNMKEARKDWPTASYFKDRGFDVALCPWMNCNTMKPMAEYLAKIGGFGLVDTTWHHLRGEEWKRMFVFASAAAWGTTPGTSFQETLRFAGCDMGGIDYEDTGYYEHQVPPTWWIDN